MLIKPSNTRITSLKTRSSRLLPMIEAHLRLAYARFNPYHLQVSFTQDLIRVILLVGELSNAFLIYLFTHGCQSLLLKLIW